MVRDRAPGPGRAATRDASSYNHPDVRTVKVMHVSREDHWEARCAPVLLDETMGCDAATVPEHLRCRRRACARHWPAPPSTVEVML